MTSEAARRYDPGMQRPLGVIAAVVLAALAAAGPARADQNDPVLNALFQQLFEAADAGQAGRVEANILRVLGQSGSPTADLLLTRGTEAMNRGDYEAALNTFNALIKLSPNFAEAWNRRATLYFQMGRLDASIADIERTLALEPRHFGALAGLGQIYVIMNHREDARRALQRALAANPHMPVVRQLLQAVERMDGGKEI